MRSEGRQTAHRRRCRVNACRRRGRTERRGELRTRRSTARSTRRSRRKRRPVEVVRSMGVSRGWRYVVRLPRRRGGCWRRVSTYCGKSRSAHIVAETMRRVERCAREKRRGAQLPEAACAKRGVRRARRVRV
eukprot:3116613-Pleurochrysis_carterae.AAC.1